MVWLIPSSSERRASGSCTLIRVCQGLAPWATAASTASLGTSWMPSEVRRIIGARAKMTVAITAGVLPTEKNATAGIR
ncbi:hypothetical protein D3C73_896380 [compost metagenome]